MSVTVVKLPDCDTRIVNSVLWTEANGASVVSRVGILEVESVKTVNNIAVSPDTNDVNITASDISVTYLGQDSNVQDAINETNNRIDVIGTGSVRRVNNSVPDVNGNVPVTDVFTFLGKASDFVVGTVFQGTTIQRSPSGGTDPNKYYNATDVSYICTALGISCCRIIHDFQGTSLMYEGRMDSGTFVYYPTAEVPQVLNDFIIGYNDAENASLPLEGKINAMIVKARLLVGINRPFEVSFRCTAGTHISLDQDLDTLIQEKLGRDITNLAYNFRLVSTTSSITTSSTYDCTNRCYLELLDGTTYMFVFDYDNFANVQVRDVTGERTTALDLYELGFVETDFGAGITLDQVIEKIELRVLEYFGIYRNWSVSQRIWDDATSGYWKNIVEAYRSKLASFGGWNAVAPGFYDLEMKSTSRNHSTDGSHILIRFYNVSSHDSKYHQFYFDRNVSPQIFGEAYNELSLNEEGNYVRGDVSFVKEGALTLNNGSIGVYSPYISLIGPNSSSSACFRVSGDTGYTGIQTPNVSASYYMKKDTVNNTSNLSIYSTLRMGDIAMMFSDKDIENVLPNTKQISNKDFGVASRQNTEGEDCIFLLDILEKMQDRIDALEAAQTPTRLETMEVKK